VADQILIGCRWRWEAQLPSSSTASSSVDFPSPLAPITSSLGAYSMGVVGESVQLQACSRVSGAAMPVKVPLSVEATAFSLERLSVAVRHVAQLIEIEFYRSEVGGSRIPPCSFQTSHPPAGKFRRESPNRPIPPGCTKES